MRSADSRSREMPLRSIAAHLALAVRASDRTLQRQISAAMTLTRDFAPVLEALEQARISTGHVRVIVDAGTPIRDHEARAIHSRRRRCGEPRMGAVSLKPAVTALAERAQPRTITQRLGEARADRRVFVNDLPDARAS